MLAGNLWSKNTFAKGIKISNRSHMMGIILEITIIASIHYKKTALVFAKRAQCASSFSVILAPNFTGKASHLLRFLSIQVI